ncbi:GFA family protein [Croceicoccus sp. Ery15]|uniref:GFA family protein n=1 Tax=Croceicoccus sp. Ery15 TaxID=1703338 RepID=UPI001E3E4DE7|nr:GFA family protein [Croceicoccus sp. Ery15]
MGELKKGACHCGSVRFEAEVDLASARRCDCSLCRMRGAVAVSAPLDRFTLLAGEDALRLYQFNTGAANHYFCGNCGIYTHHQRRSNPTQYGVNVACLEGMSPFDFPEVEVLNGQAHPKDTGATRRSGILRYTAD